MLTGSRPYHQNFMRFVQSLFIDSDEIQTDEIVFIKSCLEQISISLKAYANKVIDLAEQGTFLGDKSDLVDSLVHMHCNRFFGLSKDLEMKTYANAIHFLSRLRSISQDNLKRRI